MAEARSLSESAASQEKEKSEISTPVKVVEPLAEEMSPPSQVEKENRPIAQAEESPNSQEEEKSEISTPVKVVEPLAEEMSSLSQVEKENSPIAQNEESPTKENQDTTQTEEPLKRESMPTAEPLAEITLTALAPVKPGTLPSVADETPTEPDMPPAAAKETVAETNASTSGAKEAPTEPDKLPSGTNETPAEPDALPSGTKETPAEPDALPSGTKETPAEPDALPSGTEETPAETHTSLSASNETSECDTLPTVTKEACTPAESDMLPSATKVTPDTSPSATKVTQDMPPSAAKVTSDMLPSATKVTHDTPPSAAKVTSDTSPSASKETSTEPDTPSSACTEEPPPAKRICIKEPHANKISSTALIDEPLPAKKTATGEVSSLEPGDFLERLKCRYSTHIPNTCPAQYKLKLSYSDDNDKLARCFVNYGSKEILEATKDMKVLITVGAKAVGKTTLINGLANYIYGIQWEHDFRLQVIEEGKGDGYAPTNKITAYTFPWVEGMKIDYSLTVIDTPGFGGVADDRAIFTDNKSLLGTDKLDKIHGVLFVAQASCPKSSELEYISETVLGLFGKDLKKENIFLMTTFSDGRKPIILKHLCDFPYGHYFKFNNSALYGEKNVKHESGSDSDESDEEEEEASLTRLSWKMGAKSFEKFFRKLEEVDPYSLDQMREVIDAREKLQDSVQKLPEKITRGLKLIGRRREQKIKSSAIDSDILASNQYVTIVKVKRNRKVDISGQGRLVTNCLDCNMTCHSDCDLATEDKYKCSVMVPEDGDIEEKHCSVCSRHCGWRRHVNNPYIFEEYEEEVETISEELEVRYRAAVKNKADVEQDIFNTDTEIKKLSEEVIDLIKKVKGALQLLQHISLKPVNASEVDYINLLIEQERSSGRKGLVQRIKVLESFRKQAQLLAKLPCLEAAKSDSQSIFEQLR